MKFPKIEVAYNIIFNNTGFDWTDIQDAICDIVEKRYGVLHCISTKYHEKNNTGGVRYKIKDVWCLLYFKVNTEKLAIDVICIKEDNQDTDEEVEDKETEQDSNSDIQTVMNAPENSNLMNDCKKFLNYSSRNLNSPRNSFFLLDMYDQYGKEAVDKMINYCWDEMACANKVYMRHWANISIWRRIQNDDKLFKKLNDERRIHK